MSELEHLVTEYAAWADQRASGQSSSNTSWGAHEQGCMARLPDWAKSLSTRIRWTMLHALESGEIPDLEIATVRDKGPGWWLQHGNFGRVSERELSAAVGGWKTKPRIELPISYEIHCGPVYTAEQLEPLRRAVAEATRALDALKAELDRLAA